MAEEGVSTRNVFHTHVDNHTRSTYNYSYQEEGFAANTSGVNATSLHFHNGPVNVSAIINPDPYSYYYKEGYADTQDYIAAAIPMCVAFLAILGCYIVMRESWADYKAYSYRYSSGSRRGASNSGSAALALQSFFTATCYIVYSFALVWGPLPAPEQVDFDLAQGTTSTCTTQGFFVQLGATSAALAHSFIVWMYVLLVKYGWPEQRLMKWLPTVASVSVAMALGMAMAPATLGYYNYNSETKCWIATFPYQCDTNEDVDCIRGASASQVQMLFFLFPQWPCMVLNIVSLCQIWCAVRSLENQTAQYAGATIVSHELSTSNSLQNDNSLPQQVEVSVNRSKSKTIATQGILLSLAFIVVLGISSMEVIFKVVTGWSPYWLAQISNAFIAIPGLLFFLVFCHPRENKVMKSIEGQWTRRYVLGCFYNGWSRVLDFVVPDRSKTRVTVSSSDRTTSSTLRTTSNKHHVQLKKSSSVQGVSSV